MTATNNNTIEQRQKRDYEFLPWLAPASDEARSLCASVVSAIETHERDSSLRRRARREQDRLTFIRVISALVCNAVFYKMVAVDDKDVETAGSFHISLSNRYLGSQYSHPVQSQTLPALVRHMEACGFLERVREGYKEGYFEPDRQPIQTTLRATDALMSMAADEFGVSPVYTTATPVAVFYHQHFRRDHAGEETIILKDRAAWVDSETGKVELSAVAKTIAYRNTAKTRKFRAEMETINQWLADAPLELDKEAFYQEGGVPDPSARYLRRYFSLGEFTYGGRLFGGFWESLRKTDRGRWITIAGEEVCTLDFGQTVVWLLYAMVKQTPPATLKDCYLIPGFEDYRNGIKKMMASAPFKSERPTRFPSGTKGLFNPDTRVTEVIEAILQTHAPIAHLLFTDATIGHRMQHLESQIIIRALLKIISETDIPAALPIHDALVVPKSRHHEARVIMQAAFREEFGDGCIDIPVSVVGVDGGGLS